MQDILSRRFFSEPSQTLHRRYEALRAVCVDRQPQTEVAKRLGSTYDSLRRLVSAFRAQCQAGQVPPFPHAAPRTPGGHASPTRLGSPGQRSHC